MSCSPKSSIEVWGSAMRSSGGAFERPECFIDMLREAGCREVTPLLSWPFGRGVSVLCVLVSCLLMPGALVSCQR